MHKSFLLHQRLRYLKAGLLLVFLAVAAYALHSPRYEPPNGGTWLGYGLGGLGAALILWLMGYGVRKRAYRANLGSLQGWLSAHVYLGLALVFVVTLHTGFQFGWNVHTLAYVLTLLVVSSGVYGVYAYLRYPERMTQNQGGLTRDLMLREINVLEQECLSLAETLDEGIYHALLEDFATPLVGRSIWQQLRRVEPRRALPERLAQPSRELLEKSGALEKNAVYDATMFLVAERSADTDDPDKLDRMRRILELLGRKNALARRLRHSIQYQAIVEIWLYFHVPLAFALLAAVIVHTVTVFLYW